MGELIHLNNYRKPDDKLDGEERALVVAGFEVGDSMGNYCRAPWDMEISFKRHESDGGEYVIATFLEGGVAKPGYFAIGSDQHIALYNLLTQKFGLIATT